MHPIALGNSSRHIHKFKLCNKCNTEKPPEGGIEMRDKWICHPCWIRKVTKRTK